MTRPRKKIETKILNLNSPIRKEKYTLDNAISDYEHAHNTARRVYDRFRFQYAHEKEPDRKRFFEGVMIAFTVYFAKYDDEYFEELYDDLNKPGREDDAATHDHPHSISNLCRYIFELSHDIEHVEDSEYNLKMRSNLDIEEMEELAAAENVMIREYAGIKFPLHPADRVLSIFQNSKIV